MRRNSRQATVQTSDHHLVLQCRASDRLLRLDRVGSPCCGLWRKMHGVGNGPKSPLSEAEPRTVSLVIRILDYLEPQRVMGLLEPHFPRLFELRYLYLWPQRTPVATLPAWQNDVGGLTVSPGGAGIQCALVWGAGKAGKPHPPLSVAHQRFGRPLPAPFCPPSLLLKPAFSLHDHPLGLPLAVLREGNNIAKAKLWVLMRVPRSSLRQGFR